MERKLIIINDVVTSKVKSDMSEEYYNNLLKISQYLLEHKNTVISEDELEIISPQYKDQIINTLIDKEIVVSTKDGLLFDDGDAIVLNSYLDEIKEFLPQKKNHPKKNRIIDILKKIGAVITWFSAFITLLVSVPIILSWFDESYPTFNLYYNGRNAKSGEIRNIIVCFDDTTKARSIAEIFPVFKNVTSLSAKDFAMIYTLKIDSLSIEPKESDFKLSYDGDNNYTLKYNESMFPAHFIVKEPICKLRLIGLEGLLKMEVMATYDGVPSPYKFSTNTHFLYINSQGLDYKKWKRSCMKKIYDNFYSERTDILYSSARYDKEYEFDRRIVSTRTNNEELAEIIKDSLLLVEQSANIASPKSETPQPSLRPEARTSSNNSRSSRSRVNNSNSAEHHSITKPKLEDFVEPEFNGKIGIKDYVVIEREKGVDSLVLNIYNGRVPYTTIIATLYLQNKDSGNIDTLKREITLQERENKITIPIKENYSYVNCSISKIESKEEVDTNKISKFEIALVIILIAFGAILIRLGMYLFKGGKSARI
ncbi:MAG: hypothetical protein IKY01_05355 [Prevotella sp.]|nr:hypothetical protein [Prevotella sp.]